jgi:hypothetical protein
MEVGAVDGQLLFIGEVHHQAQQVLNAVPLVGVAQDVQPCLPPVGQGVLAVLGEVARFAGQADEE